MRSSNAGIVAEVLNNLLEGNVEKFSPDLSPAAPRYSQLKMQGPFTCAEYRWQETRGTGKQAEIRALGRQKR